VADTRAFSIWRPPDTVPLTLALPPRLESWDAKTAPSQVALGQYLNHVAELTRRQMTDASTGLLSLELAVSLPEDTHLPQGGHDLDNFLYPIVRRLGSHRFASAHGARFATECASASGGARPKASHLFTSRLIDSRLI